MEKKYGKLVRGNIPEIISATGKKPIYRVMDRAEHLRELIAKMHEETDEFAEALSLEEFADMSEVQNQMQKEMGFTDEQVEAARQAKAAKNGDFRGRIFLEGVE